VGEVPLPDVPRTKDVEWKFLRLGDRSRRKPVAVADFGWLGGSLQPYPDPYDAPTLFAGAAKRFLFAPPTPEPGIYGRLRDFTVSWLERNIKPLDYDTDVSFETWVENINHPESRKEELKRAWTNARGQVKAQHASVKMFTKFENYSSYKHARAINSRHDVFKCAFGPTVKQIEKKLFRLKWFVKYVPVRDRPALLMSLHRPGGRYFASDFTSFESLFTADIMRATEYEMYRHMTQNLGNHEEFMRLVEMKMGKNSVENKNMRLSVDATRMSGEMDTSLANGFCNLMFWAFLCDELGSELTGFVEGDDGIFRVDGPAPTTEDFARLGLVCKIEEHTRLETASFCGNVFHPDVQTQITDPRSAAGNLFWMDARFAGMREGVRMALLRSKALSMKHQYPCHPILSCLSEKVLELTRSYDVRSVLTRKGMLSEWDRTQLTQALDELGQNHSDNSDDLVIPYQNRMLVEELYGIDVGAQLSFEAQVERFKLGDILRPTWDVPEDWAHYFNEYVSHDLGERPPPRRACHRTAICTKFRGTADNSDQTWHSLFEFTHEETR
jgi:hypothetical protein